LFQEAATELRDRAAEYSSEPNDETATLARDAWREAMAVWEEAEIFQFGPAAPSANPGGRGLRELVHSWPLIPRCKVDENTVSEFSARDSFFGSAETSPSSGRTLHALEYLLFYGGVDNGCTPYSSINSLGSWGRLGAAEIRSRKIAYAARAAEDVLRRADVLVDAWSPEGDDFGTILGEARSPFKSEQAALNSVNDGLFYIDRQLKDQKLALPLGMHDECPADRCPSAVEALYAGTSVDHIRRNLAGFRKLFQGCGEGNAGIGFDDWLIAKGAGDLATRMLDALAGAEAAVDGLDAPLEQLIVSDPARVEAAHAALKGLTDPFKAEFTSVLNLEPPGGPGGGIDND
jgi:predicted lipoprotein